MSVNKRLGDLFGDVFEGIEREVLNAMENEEIGEEDTITGRLLGVASERINHFGSNQGMGPGALHIESIHFSSKHKKSQETLSGADGAVVLNVKIGQTTIRKFYLFQAKRTDKTPKINPHAMDQKFKMLHHTADSFFLFYSRASFDFISAFIIEEGDKPSDLPSKTYKDFHEDFFNCFIGDLYENYPFRRLPMGFQYNFLNETPWVRHTLVIEVTDQLE